MAEGSKGRVYLRQVFPLGTDKTQGGEVLCSRWVQRGPQNDTIHNPPPHTHIGHLYTSCSILYMVASIYDFRLNIVQDVFRDCIYPWTFWYCPSALNLYRNLLTVSDCFHLPLEDVFASLNLFLLLKLKILITHFFCKTFIWLSTYGATSWVADWTKWAWVTGRAFFQACHWSRQLRYGWGVTLFVFPLFSSSSSSPGSALRPDPLPCWEESVS